jgi:hypothetical protein
MDNLIVSEELLSEIETLQSLLKNNVSGMFGGLRRSKRLGSSAEFADYRDYMPGDDVAKIDWNAYARFDKLYEKLFYDERQMHTRIYIDASRSMRYGDEKKAEMAIKLAAALCYISVAEMDKVSVYAISGGVCTEVISGIVGKESYLTEIGKLGSIVFDGQSRISEAILPSSVGRADGYSIIISDYLTDSNYEDAIDYLADRKRDILCIQVLSRDEINPQIRGKNHLFDSEDARKYYRKNIDKEIIKAYKEALEYTKSRISNYCYARGAEYMQVSAEDSLSEIFLAKMINIGVLK